MRPSLTTIKYRLLALLGIPSYGKLFGTDINTPPILDEVYSISPQFSLSVKIEGRMSTNKAWELWRELTSTIGKRFGDAFDELGYAGTVSDRLVLERQGYILTIVASVTGIVDSFNGMQRLGVEHALEHVLGEAFEVLTNLGCSLPKMSSMQMPPGLAEAFGGGMPMGMPLGVIRVPVGEPGNGQQPQDTGPDDEQLNSRSSGPYL